MRAMFGIVTLIACLSALPAHAQPCEKDAVALAERGAQFIKTYGKAEMIARINRKDPQFYQGALYLAMRDLRGITIAHPTNALIGKDFLDVPDADGKAFRHEMVAVARGAGKGWVDYKFRNPATGKVAPKSTYVLRVGDVALEAGVYKY
nr:cache domain-containing protein [uncultured Duganella sp.]